MASCNSSFSFFDFSRINYIYHIIEANRGARGITTCRALVRLWGRFPLEEMKIFKMITILFLCSGNEAKRGLEFRHSTRNASRV